MITKYASRLRKFLIQRLISDGIDATAKKYGNLIKYLQYNKPVEIKSTNTKDPGEIVRRRTNAIRNGYDPFFEYVAPRDRRSSVIDSVFSYLSRNKTRLGIPERYKRAKNLVSRNDKNMERLDNYSKKLMSRGEYISDILSEALKSDTSIFKGGRFNYSIKDRPYFFTGDPAVAFHFANNPVPYSFPDLPETHNVFPLITVSDLKHSKSFKNGKTFFSPQLGPYNRRERIDRYINGDVFATIDQDRIPSWYYKDNFEIVLPGHEASGMPKNTYIIVPPEGGIKSRPWMTPDETVRALRGVMAVPYSDRNIKFLDAISMIRDRLWKRKHVSSLPDIRKFYEKGVDPIAFINGEHR